MCSNLHMHIRYSNLFSFQFNAETTSLRSQAKRSQRINAVAEMNAHRVAIVAAYLLVVAVWLVDNEVERCRRRIDGLSRWSPITFRVIRGWYCGCCVTRVKTGRWVRQTRLSSRLHKFASSSSEILAPECDYVCFHVGVIRRSSIMKLATSSLHILPISRRLLPLLLHQQRLIDKGITLLDTCPY